MPAAAGFGRVADPGGLLVDPRDADTKARTQVPTEDVIAAVKAQLVSSSGLSCRDEDFQHPPCQPSYHVEDRM